MRKRFLPAQKPNSLAKECEFFNCASHHIFNPPLLDEAVIKRMCVPFVALPMQRLHWNEIKS